MSSARLVQAEQLLRNNKFEEARELLRSIEDPGGFPRVVYGQYCLLLAETCLKLGDYSFEGLDGAIEIFRFHKDSSKFAQAKYLRGWMYASLGQHRDAQEALLEAYAGYVRCQDPGGSARVLNRLAYVQMQLGTVDVAVSTLTKCTELCFAANRPNDALVAMENAAVLCTVSGSLTESVGRYRALADELDRFEQKNRFQFYANFAIVLSMRGETEEAHCRLKTAESLVGGFKRENVILLENRGFLHYVTGKFDTSIAVLSKGLTEAIEIAPESALVSQIKRLLADCNIAKEKFTKAQKFASEALEVAEKIGQKVEIAACHRVFAQVAAHEGKSEDARKEFKFAIDLFNQISSRYELAVTRFQAATSGQFEKGESLAMLYLAKEYCEAEQVAPYLVKIDAALAKLEPRKIALQPSDSDTVKIVTRSKRMLSLLDLARHVAPTRMTVLLTGATGTGKDLMARWIHEQSGRTGRFLSQNFAALPGPLAESELFGHRKGTFTGASDDKPGLFEAAAGGTFYLNEIAEAPLELQAKLLEVLETRSLRRLGETTDRSVDIRIIAATNHDLAKAVRENRFRADLYHRLNEINIALPPLADRTEDIPDLIAHFVKELGVSATNGSAAYLERLSSIVSAHSWPGNIRELRTFVRKLLVIAENDISKLPEIAQDQLPMTDESQLVRILEQSDWNQTRVAETLGVSEGTIRKRIRKFGLDRD